MFFKTVVFSCLLAFVLSAPADVPVEIVSQNNDIQPDGAFQWSYESADGTKQEEVGTLKQVGDVQSEAVQGSVVYKDPTGVEHGLRYIADENGYHAEGADIPVGPEVPPLIAKALKYIEEHPVQPVVETRKA